MPPLFYFVSVFFLSLSCTFFRFSLWIWVLSLYSPLCLLSRSRLCYFNFLSHLIFFTPSAPLLSPSYIIFFLNITPPPSSSPFYLSLSRDLNSAHHLSYFPLPHLICPPKPWSPSFTYMLSYSLPTFLIVPRCISFSCQCFFLYYLQRMPSQFASFTFFPFFPPFYFLLFLPLFLFSFLCHLLFAFLCSLPMCLPSFPFFILSLFTSHFQSFLCAILSKCFSFASATPSHHVIPFTSVLSHLFSPILYLIFLSTSPDFFYPSSMAFSLPISPSLPFLHLYIPSSSSSSFSLFHVIFSHLHVS